MLALRSPLHHVIQSLTALGAVIVGSVGNDSDPRDTEMHMNGARMAARYPAAFPEVISVGAVDKDGNAAPYSNYPVAGSGVATYGGGLPKPVHHAGAMTTATNIDALRGIYSSPVYPALSVDDPQHGYGNTHHNAWSYWSGTSFATPIISATAARILEHLQASNIPSHQ